MTDTEIVLTADDDGRRSSIRVGRRVVAQALSVADPIGAADARRETAWRDNYITHFRRLVEASLQPGDDVRIAEEGLASMHAHLECSYGGASIEATALLSRPAARPLTETITGRGHRETELTIPYRGKKLRGAELSDQLGYWVDAGIMEPSAADAVRAVCDHPEWLSLPEKSAVVLGASAEMSPLPSLLRWGATVYAVDLPQAPLWRRLTRTARELAGTMHCPTINSRPGADLLTDLGSVHQWLSSINESFCLGNYVYADGVTNLRLAGAIDLMTQSLTSQRPDMALSFLATPTDIYAVDASIVEAATAAYNQGRVGSRLRPAIRALSGGKLLRRNYAPAQAPGINDSALPQQGPNYLLAKRIHRWRTGLARRDGHRVSLTVAPPTRTRSVVKNKALATAYAGAYKFGIEVFEPDTSATLMAALCVHDLYRADIADRPIWHDEQDQAVHGGLWRGAYAPRSALSLALLLGAMRRG